MDVSVGDRAGICVLQWRRGNGVLSNAEWWKEEEECQEGEGY